MLIKHLRDEFSELVKGLNVVSGSSEISDIVDNELR